MEEVIGDFAGRSHIEDIGTFANIFGIAKRTGGNLIEIIRNTTQIIADKIETKTEIDTMVASQKIPAYRWQPVSIHPPYFFPFQHLCFPKIKLAKTQYLDFP